MRLGGTTFSFMWGSTALEAMRRLSSIGLREFDVILAPGHLWADELDAGARRELRGAIERDGLAVESLNMPALDFNLGSCLAEVRRQGIGCYVDALRLSAELGGRGVVVVPGRVSGLLAPRLADTIGWLGDSVAALLSVADQTGQDLLLETHPQTAIPTAESMAAFVESIGRPRLRVAYDVANAEFIGEDQVGAIRRLSSLLGQVHLSDARKGSWKHDPAGLGTVRFDAVRQVLDEIAFDGLAVVEVISGSALADTEATLRRLGT